MGCTSSKEKEKERDGGAAAAAAGTGGEPAAAPAEPPATHPEEGNPEREHRPLIPSDYNPDAPGLSDLERGRRKTLKKAFLMGQKGEPLPPDWKESEALEPEERADRQSLRNAFGRGRRSSKKGKPPSTGGSKSTTTRQPARQGGKAVPGGPPPSMVKVQGGKPSQPSTTLVKGIRGSSPPEDRSSSSSSSDTSTKSDDGENSLLLVLLSSIVLSAVCSESAMKTREAEEKEATMKRIEELEARAVEAERRAEELMKHRQPTSPLSPQSPGPRSPGVVSVMSEATTAPPNVIGQGSEESSASKSSVIHNDTDDGQLSDEVPESKKTELREGLRVYSVETSIEPAGTLYSIQNMSDFTVAVVLSFIGSENIDLKVDEIAEARGTKILTVHPPYGMEVSCEVLPSDTLKVVRVTPANEYAAWTVAVSSRWQLLTAESPARGTSEAPAVSYEVLNADSELKTLKGGGIKTATSQSLPFVDAHFRPSAKFTTETGVPSNGWRRSEKIMKKTVINALFPRDCKIQAGEDLRWLAMGLALVLDTNPDILTSVYPSLVAPNKKCKDLERVGAFEAWWCVKGWWTKILTDSYVPVNGKRPALFSDEEVWPLLAVKSYAKARRGFRSVKHGTVGHFLQDVTGCPYKRIPLSYAGNEFNTNSVHPDGDYMVLWEDLKLHLDNERVVGVSTKEHLETEMTWRGDCDVELVDLDGVRPLWSIPPDTTLPVLEYSEEGGLRLKIRNRWGWPLTKNTNGKIDTSDRWVNYSDVLNAFSSVTIGYATPGWNDVRLRLHATDGNIADTFSEVTVENDTACHVWLGSDDEKPSLLGIMVLQPTENNRYSDYTVRTMVGVESSAHVWGEVTLPRSTKPYVILPLIMDGGEQALKRGFTLAMRTSEASKGSVVFRGSKEEVVHQSELGAILQFGESKVVAEDVETGKVVSLKIWQQYRLLGCAVKNGSDYPVKLSVNFTGSAGYECVRAGPDVSRRSLAFFLEVPARSSRHVCSLAAPGESWEYSLEAESAWLPPPATKAKRQKDALVIPSSYPYVQKEIQVNGDVKHTNHTSFPTPL